MGFMTGVNEAAVNGRLPFLGVGQYVVEAQACHTGESKLDGTPFYKTEVKVIEASEGAAQKVGDLCCILINEDRKYKYHLGELKSLAGALSGEGVNLAGADKYLENAAGPTNPTKGNKFKIVVSNKDKLNPDTGKPYTRQSFFVLETAAPTGQAPAGKARGKKPPATGKDGQVEAFE